MGFKKPTKGFIITVIIVLVLGTVWGVTHYIDDEVLTRKVYIGSLITIIAALLGVGVWFLLGLVKVHSR